MDPATQAALDTVLAEEPVYLEGMERVVGMLETSAGRQVDLLRWCGVAAMLAVLGLLVGVYFVVLQPALNLIRQQIAKLTESESRHRVMAELLSEARDELETRVTERTGELVAANRALEHEIAEREAAEKRMRELSAGLAHASRVTAPRPTGHRIGARNQPAAGVDHQLRRRARTVCRKRHARHGASKIHHRGTEAGGVAGRSDRAPHAQLRAARDRTAVTCRAERPGSRGLRVVPAPTRTG